MKGAMNLEAVAELPHVRDWLEHSRAAVETVRADCHDHSSDELLRVTEANVLLQIQHLRTHPAVAAKVNNGEIGLHGWVYHIETGAVTCYDEAARQFVPVAERYASLLAAHANEKLAQSAG
jgi:carbonic anhydrase